MEPYKENQQEKRRVLELNAGFFEKLSALNAGSIAVAASIILAIVLKPDVPRLTARPVLHEILVVVALLWGLTLPRDPSQLFRSGYLCTVGRGIRQDRLHRCARETQLVNHQRTSRYR